MFTEHECTTDPGAPCDPHAQCRCPGCGERELIRASISDPFGSTLLCMACGAKVRT